MVMTTVGATAMAQNIRGTTAGRNIPHAGNDMDGVTGANLKNLKTGEIRHIELAGFFVAIGHQPNTELVKEQIDLDEQGYIKVQSPSAATNIPGVFAAGDVCDPHYRQAIVAAGKGCIAAIDVERFLQSQQ